LSAIYKDAGWLKLHQTNYTKDMLTRYNMLDCKPVDTPMDAGTAKAMMQLPLADECEEHVDKSVLHKYRTLVGELIWLCIQTRPDIRFTLCLLSRFLSNATQAHLNLAMQRPLRYLKGTMTDGIVFLAGTGEWLVTGESDADLAGDIRTQRSTLGHYLKIGRYGTVIVHCGLERKICTSTGQAETYAMLGLVKDVIWLRTQLYELHFGMDKPTLVGTDNDGVVAQSTKAINHSNAKHYRIAQAFIRGKGRELIIKVFGVNTADNVSDIFTKALAAGPFLKHKAELMGPQTCP
jgi:hypothetical protein